MRLEEKILDVLKPIKTWGSLEGLSGLAYDSRVVKKGDLFFCLKGNQTDGHLFAVEASNKGACGVISSRYISEVKQFQAIVEDTRLALARVAVCFYDDPSQKLEVVGVTGTNGKTTTTYLLESIFRTSGFRTGLVGTVELRIGDEKEKLSHTTPESLDLQRILSRMVSSSVQKVAMEVSSHAIDQRRIEGISFKVLVFTNISRDHLDYHKSFGRYQEVKKSLFENNPQVPKIVNIDDELGAKIASSCKEVVTYGIEQKADIIASDLSLSADRTQFILRLGKQAVPVTLKLKGKFNVYNSLAAAGAAKVLGCDLEKIKEGLEKLENVPGRMEFINQSSDFFVVIDYAHTPDGLEKVLINSRQISKGKLILVFGCGGDRDKGKRPLMGKVAASLSDYSIITSDNPRSEVPEEIIEQIEKGFLTVRKDGYLKITDRREAIFKAIEMAKPGDLVLIAGKGHEDYQIFRDRTVHFSDREEASKALEKKRGFY